MWKPIRNCVIRINYCLKSRWSYFQIRKIRLKLIRRKITIIKLRRNKKANYLKPRWLRIKLRKKVRIIKGIKIRIRIRLRIKIRKVLGNLRN